MLDEHQVGLLAALGAESISEALRERNAAGRVVLGEGRIGDDPVEAHQLAAFQVERLSQGVPVLQVGVADAVQDHVHLGDRPDPAVVLLAVERQVARIASVLGDVLVREDQHASRTRAGVVDPHPLLRIGQADHHPHHGAGGVELASLLARRVGELPDQILVGGPQEVGKLEVLVAQAVAVEVVDELAQALVGDFALADRPVEVDVVQHPFQPAVLLFEGAQRLVESVADGVVQLVADESPASPGRHEKGVGVELRGVGPLASLLPAAAFGELLFKDPLPARLELVRAALQKEHAEDELLELRGVHLAAQDVRCAEEVTFQLLQREGSHDLFSREILLASILFEILPESN